MHAIDTRPATATETHAQLAQAILDARAHVAAGGKAPSFREGTPGALLGIALLEMSHPLFPLATLWQ